MDQPSNSKLSFNLQIVSLSIHFAYNTVIPYLIKHLGKFLFVSIETPHALHILSRVHTRSMQKNQQSRSTLMLDGDNLIASYLAQRL